jgi:hypothetical protein
MRVNVRAIGFAIAFLALRCWAQEFQPNIPRAWDDKAVHGLEAPLAQRDQSPRYMSAEEYYKEPEIIFDTAKLSRGQRCSDRGLFRSIKSPRLEQHQPWLPLL